MRDEGAGQSLDAIRTGLAEGFAAVAVAADFVVAQLAHADLRDGNGFQQLLTCPDGDGGVHFMRGPGQGAQDADGVVAVGRLAQHHAIQDDRGVRRQ
ncbi:hypothetical protein D3C72_2142700 [compost metagenome]